jgi:dipeptidase
MGGSSLDYAYRLSKGSDEELLQLLYDAEVAITRAASLVATTDFSQEALDVTKSLRDNVSLIGKTLQNKRVDDDEF